MKLKPETKLSIINFLKSNTLLSLGIGIFLLAGLSYILFLFVNHPLVLGGVLVFCGLIKIGWKYKDGFILNVKKYFTVLIDFILYIPFELRALILVISIFFVVIYSTVRFCMFITPHPIPSTPLIQTLVSQTDFAPILEVQYLPNHNVIKFESGNSYLVPLFSVSAGQKAQIQTWNKGDGTIGRAIFVEGLGSPKYLVGE
jgi:hypothetical protein